MMIEVRSAFPALRCQDNFHPRLSRIVADPSALRFQRLYARVSMMFGMIELHTMLIQDRLEAFGQPL